MSPQASILPAKPQSPSSNAPESEEARTLAFPSSPVREPDTHADRMGTKASTSPGASVQAPSETMSNPFSVSGSSKAKSDGIRLSAIDRADSIWNLFGRPVSSRTEMSASAPRSFSFPRPGNFWLRKQGPHVAGPSTIVGFEGNAVHRLQSGRSSAAAQIAHATVSHCYVDFWTLARLIAINRICLFHLFL